MDREADTGAAIEAAEGDIANTRRVPSKLRVPFKNLRVLNLKVVSEEVIAGAVEDAVAIAMTDLKDPTLSGGTKEPRELNEKLKVVLERKDPPESTTRLKRDKKVVRDLLTDLESSSIMIKERMK